MRILRILLIIVLFWAFSVGCRDRGMTFDASRWASDITSRSHMVGELISTNKCIGKSLDDVTAMLGPADNFADQFVYVLDGKASLQIRIDEVGFVKGVGGSRFPSGLIEQKFNKQQWRAGTLYDDLRMARHLIRDGRDSVVGQTREGVLQMLGPPSKKFYNLHYHLTTRSVGGDFLSVRFVDGVVSELVVIRDS